MYIANFTPDAIDWMHVGITGTIETDDILEFDDARGKHILNKWGARGLLRVSYEDKGNEESLRKQAMKLYRDFWSRHIQTFNQHNQSLKNENKPYVHPDPKTEEKAGEFGIPLVGPWKLDQEVSKADTKKMEKLESRVEDLTEMMEKMLEMNKEVVKQRDTALLDQFQGLDNEQFRAWFEKNMSKIRSWPEGVQALVKSYWDTSQNGEMYPLSS